jgi:hypothetical protein
VLLVLYKCLTMNFLKRIRLQYIIALLVSVIFLLLLVWKGEDILSAAFYTITINLTSAIIASILVGIYFDLSAKEGFQREIESLLSINSLVKDSGLKEYHNSWDQVDLKSFFESSKKVDIYIYFGTTLFSQYQHVIEEFLKRKGTKLRIFISHEDNKFLEASSILWQVSDSKYSYHEVRKKVIDTVSLFDSIVKKLKESKKLKASFKLYKVKKHPVNFSFYKFDNIMVIALNKLSHHKTPKPPVIILSKDKTTQSLYQRIDDDFATIFERDIEFLEESIG